LIPNKRAILKTIANPKPIFLALGWSLGLSLEDTIEINTILSIPKTISKNVSVSNATHASVEAKTLRKSILIFWVKI
jgi:hypothetical protein